ncbi:MAG TPA: TonB-dependent receptor plug domain-containing protein, partial [Longimicrobium sp.]
MAVALLLCLPPRLAGQRPGEIAGQVTESGNGAPVERAAVEIVELGLRAWTDAAGRFRLRGVEPGPHRLRVTRTGFVAGAAQAEVRNGEEAWVAVALVPAPLRLEAVRASAAADPVADGTRVGRAEIQASGARTAAEIVERVPGVVVRGTGATGARTVSIRGSGADAVLVLVDGVALNDPVTGEADLSGVPAQSIESVTVLPGARSARYGPRAEAGVVLIQTRAGETTRSVELAAGTLGERAARAEWGAPLGGWALQAGGGLREMAGRFAYPRDPNDPVPVVRRNADLGEASFWGAAGGRVAGGDLRLRGGWEWLDRGLPGVGHTPALHAREQMSRGRASAAWSRGATRAVVSAATQRIHFADPQPPFGTAYNDTTRVGTLNARVESSRTVAGGGAVWGGGVEGQLQRIRAPLSDAAPRTLAGFGAFGHAGTELRLGGRTASVEAEGRVDRDGVTGGWYGSRALSLAMDLSRVRVHLANRSAYSPPSLGDQFFRDGVGIVPNPELRAERVPNEWEAGAAASGTLAGARVSASAAAYDADVRGMIVWMQRFNGRWTPGNVNAHRRGAEARGEARVADLRVSASYALARITYDRELDDDVQVVYR